jgi:hypothetical protein
MEALRQQFMASFTVAVPTGTTRQQAINSCAPSCVFQFKGQISSRTNSLVPSFRIDLDDGKLEISGRQC